MTVRVGINGFGRIGRNFFRSAKQRGADIDFVAVNDLGSLDQMAHLLKYDSVLGVLPEAIKATKEGISVDGDVLKVLQVRNPTELPWGERKVRLKRAFFASLAEVSPVEAVADFDGDLFVAAGSRDRLVKYVGQTAVSAKRARSCEQRVIEGADHFFNSLDPKLPVADGLLARTADYFARTLRGG